MKTYHVKIIDTRALLIILLSFLLASATHPQPGVSKEVSFLWSEIEEGVELETARILEVVLPANLSTGYLWEYGFYNQSVLKSYGEPVFIRTSTDLDAQETQKLHFEAIDESENDLILVYQRSFDNEGEDQQTVQVHVVVK